MKNEEKMKALLEAELNKEAEEIDKMLEADKSLENVTVPESMDEAVMAQIRKLEEEKAAYEKLSPEDKEALRIGKEIQFQKADDGGLVKFRKKRKKRVFLLVAAVAVLVLAMGTTSIGGRPFISDMFEQMLAGRKNVNVDTLNQDKVVSKSVGEEEAYQKIKDEFGFDAVDFGYYPEGMSFLECTVDVDMQEALLVYLYGDKILEYQILTNYREKSIGYDVEDQFIDECEVEISDITIKVRHYVIAESDEDEYIAQFEYKGANYMLRTTMDYEELEKILKNLQFI